MNKQEYLFDADLLQKEIYRLHMKRMKGKVPSKRIGRLSKKDRLLILDKTNSKCHICGTEISIINFQADHVTSHIIGGLHKIDNYLPSCQVCNNSRWHYLPEELQLILKIGVFAKTEIEKGTILGKSIASKFVLKELRRFRNNTTKI